MNRIIKFQADWCQPCKALTKNLEGLNFLIEIVDCDEEPTRASDFNVRGLPTLVFMKGEEEVDRVVGLVSREKVEALIEANYK